VPKVFISYTHDSQEHSDRVWELCERLRQDGVDCCIDLHERSPAEGWPRWCRNQVQESDFVLVVCTETYTRRYEGKEEPGKGLGGSWEGSVVTQELYEDQGKNTKFIPVVFSPDHKNPLRSNSVLRRTTISVPRQATTIFSAASRINLRGRSRMLARYGRCHRSRRESAAILTA